ncbi:hypothetical protein GS539_20950 [Rhodococcus hoagii]|nr:hypothetical protein [Prescottella equi]
MSGNATGAPLVRAGAPDGCSVADKSGGAGPIRNDIAIVTPPGRAPAFLALLAKISTLQHETMSWSATPPRPGSGAQGQLRSRNDASFECSARVRSCACVSPTAVTAASYSRDRLVLLVAGSSVERATCTPASSNAGS